MTCWLRPDGVRDGIWRLVRFPGDRNSDGDAAAGAGCGVGVPAGESDGDSSELISMVVEVTRRPQCVGRAGRLGRRLLFLRSRSAETMRHRFPRNERHGTVTGGRREKEGRMREATG